MRTALRSRARQTAVALTVTAVAAVSLASPASASPTWLPAETVFGAPAGSPLLSVGANGDAVVAWVRHDGTSQRLYAARRSAGGTWTAPSTISAPGVDAMNPAVAVDGQGNAVAAWVQGASNRVYASRQAGAGAWGSPFAASPSGQIAANPQVAAGADGDAAVMWTAPGSSSRTYAITRPAGGSWSGATALSSSTSIASGSDIAIDGRRDVVAVLTRKEAGGYRVQVIRKMVNGSWGSAATISPGTQSAYGGEIAVNDRGDAVVAWSTGVEPETLHASRRPAGGTWSAATPISNPGQDTAHPEIAMDAAGNAVAVWSHHDGIANQVQAARQPVGGSWTSPEMLSEVAMNSYGPHVSVDDDGVAVAAWNREYEDGTTKVHAKTMSPSGSWSSSWNMWVAGKFPDSQVATDGNGHHIVAWYRGGAISAATRDGGGPLSTVVAPTARRQTSTTFDVAWSATDAWSGVANHDVRYREAPHNAGFGAFATWQSGTTESSAAFTASPGRTVCLSARARDTLDNEGDWSAERCTATPIDDRTFVASSSWTRGSSTAYYQGTYTLSKTTGATLTRTGVQAKHIALLATKCASCGSVKVLLNGTTLATVNLYASTPQRKQLISVKTFSSLQTGTLKLQVVSPSGKAVYVDGVVASRV